MSGRRLALGLVLAVAPPVPAEQLVPSPQDLGPEDLVALAAVGRISYGGMPEPGDAVCSGTLVAPDLVLTASHCILASREDPARVVFAAGAFGETAHAIRHGAEVIPAEGAGTAGDLSSDLALLRLDAAIPSDVVAPLTLLPRGDGREWNGRTPLVGYRRDAPDRPVIDRACSPLSFRPGVLGLTCPAVSGNSGAAVLVADGDGAWHLGAVMVATVSGGPVRSYAAVPDAGFRALIPP